MLTKPWHTDLQNNFEAFKKILAGKKLLWQQVVSKKS
jgi:hypothetical protein